MFLKIRSVIVVGFIASLFSCFPVSTSDPKKAFEYWAGFEPPKKFEVIHGEYYQSPHFTLEFEAIFHLHPPREWWLKLKDQFMLSECDEVWSKPDDLPNWFTPPSNSIRYCSPDDFTNSTYFEDPNTGEIFIYIIQY